MNQTSLYGSGQNLRAKESMMRDFLTLDDLDFKDKVVLLRVDINVPVDKDTKKISESKRISESITTIKELADKKAKVVVLAHQGRAGDYDFLPLDQHTDALKNVLKEEFDYVDDTIGIAARERMKSLNPEKFCFSRIFDF